MKIIHLLPLALCFVSISTGCGHGHKWQEIKKPEYFAGRATYTHGTMYYKSCSECGAISKETFADDDKLTYRFNINEYEEKDADGMAEVLGGKDIIKIFISATQRFRKYKINYDTYNLKNERIQLSAALLIPFDDGEPDIDGFVIDHHPTITGKDKCPTNMWTEMTLNVVNSCAVLQCDLLGLGDSEDKVFDYHCRHLSDRNTMDAIFACQQIILHNFNVDIANLKMFNIGYSQGGYDSLSFLRYMEQEATDEEKALVHIKKTYSGSGAYNIQIMFDKSLENESFKYIEYILMGVMSTHEYHPECYTKTVDDYLTPAGKELHEILEQKDDDVLAEFKNSHDISPHKIFVPEYLDDKTSEWSKSVERAAAKENLLDGNWKPSGEVWMFYPVNDDMVTTECSKEAERVFAGLDNVQFFVDDFSKDHRSAGTPFYVINFIDILTSNN